MLTLFGCSHKNYSWPQKLQKPEGTETHYVVCVGTIENPGCGQEFYYNWKEMKLGKKREVSDAANQVQRVQAPAVSF